MISLQRTRREEREVRPVEAGRLACPRFGDADVEECYVCGYLREMQGEPADRVTCAYHELPIVTGVPSLIASRAERPPR